MRSTSVHGPIGQPAPALIATSSASGVTRASSRTRMQSFRRGIRTRLTTNPGVSWHCTTSLPRRTATSAADGHGRCRCQLALGDLDQRHQRRRVEEVHADDALRPRRRRGDLGHREGRRIGGEDRVGAADPVQVREERALRLDLLDDRLDDEVAPRERVEIGGRRETTDRRIALVLRHLALLDLAAEELPDARGSCGAEIGCDLAPDRLVAGFDGELGDPGSHRPETDHADRRNRCHAADSTRCRQAASACSCAERSSSSATRSPVVRNGSETTSPVAVESATTTAPSLSATSTGPVGTARSTQLGQAPDHERVVRSSGANGDLAPLTDLSREGARDAAAHPR